MIPHYDFNHVLKSHYFYSWFGLINIKRQNAEILLFLGYHDAAINMMLQASPPQIYRAIKFNIRLFRWEPALLIALENGIEFIKLVLWYRRQHRLTFQEEETIPLFREKNSEFQDQFNLYNLAHKKKVLKEKCSKIGN